MTSNNPIQIGRYVVEAVIGRGAMGVIYRAHDPEIDRVVAIKLVAAALLEGADGAEYLSRFRREARASGRCAHPNIVAVHDFGTHDGHPFLAMEFVDGVSLQNLLARGKRFSPAEAVLLTGQVLDALACAHAAGIIHRDIKPANVIVTSDLRVKVADFGIARFGDSDLTQLGDMVGTPSYMSPEQCRGEAVDARTDIFSAGSLLYELLTGARAFAGGSVVEVIRRVVDGAPPELPASVISAAPRMRDVLAGAMARDPDARFGSAAQMAQALRDAWRGAASPADDGTVILAAPRAPVFQNLPDPAGVAENIDPTVLSSVERSLAQYVGPIAKMLVRSAVRKAATVGDLYGTLAESITAPEDRRRFLQGSPSHSGIGASRTVSGSLTGRGSAVRREPPASSSGTGRSFPAPQPTSAADLDRANRSLTKYVGPLARVLIRRAAADGASADEVWRRAAQHIEDEAERRRFLKEREQP